MLRLIRLDPRDHQITNIKSFFAPREQSRWDSQRDSPQSYSVWLHWTAVFVAQSTVDSTVWHNRRKEKCFKYGWLSNLKMVNNEYSFKFKSFATNRLATFKWERIINWNPKRSTGEYPGRCGCNRSGSPLPHRVCPTVRIRLLLSATLYHVMPYHDTVSYKLFHYATPCTPPLCPISYYT